MKKLLWLDDYRDPFDTKIDWLVFSPIGRNVEVIWVKNYKEFVEYISNNSLPDAICFDHDLGLEEDGYDCAKWLVNYCLDNNCKLPITNSQSANTTGRENIIKLFENFIKHT